MTEQEINNWAATIPGFKLSEANADLVKGYLVSRNLIPVTPENLTKAVNDPKLRSVLEWEKGFEPREIPAAPARPKGSRFNQLADAGVRQFRAEGDSHAERLADAANREKEAEAQRQAAITRQKAAEQHRLQKAEESQILFRASGLRAGEVDHAATAAAQQAAREKWAKIRGVVTKPANYRIPLMATALDLKDGTPAQLRVWMDERRRNNMPTYVTI